MHKDSKLMQTMITNMSRQFGKRIDAMILDDLFASRDKFYVVKKWKTRKGITMRRLRVGGDIYQWLKENYDQFGKSNPQWWVFQGEINITERMFTLLSLRFSAE